jgi:hypothetical protein
MPSVHEHLTEQFRRWEIRGRGWRVFDEPVYPEPPFCPFHGHYLPDAPAIDDGHRPTFLSSLVGRLNQKTRGQPPPPILEAENEPEAEPLIREPLVELQTSLPAKLDISPEAFAQFLRNLSLCREPIAFEIVGAPGRVGVQFAAEPGDAPLVRRQLQAYFPEVAFQPCEGTLEASWESCESEEILIVEFGLEREFMFSLRSGKLDPFIGMIGALAELQPGDIGLFQILFEPARDEWTESIVRSVTGGEGKPFFVNIPELTTAGENKVKSPLYAAVVRIAVKSRTYEGVIQLARDLAGSLRVFSNPEGNRLIPLNNDGYPLVEHIADVIRRQSRRSGMLLNSEELIAFVHFPSSAVRSPSLQRDSGKTKAAPAIVRNAGGLLIGDNIYLENSIPVRLTAEQRTRHTHIIGASGTGKSTLLFNLIRQDIENGEGCAVFDPHGDLVERVLGIIPPERIHDVVLVDPSDEEYSIGFNILSAHSDLEKNLLASDLVSVFQRLSTSWGDQMGSVLQNAILAFLESSRPGTLADLRRFLIEPAFRAEFLKSVQDPEIVYYWQKGFPQLTGNKSIGPILTRLETFLSPKPIRYMVSQPENRLDFVKIMDSGKIFLAKLPEGLLGKENSYLLGTLLVSKFQQMAMSRQAQHVTVRKDFWIYADEFHNYISPSMAEILSGARKYRIGLTLAHHELHQLQRNPEVASAVMSHPFTRIVFRVGDDDARKLGEGFAFFEAQDLKNLETGQAIARVERSNYDFNLTVPLPEAVDEAKADTRRREVITSSREKYGTKRADVQAMLAKHQEPPAPPTNIPAVAASVPPEPFKARGVPKPAVPPSVEVKPSEVPSPVIVQERQSLVAAEKRTPSVLPDLGKGGEQHKAIQRRIKEAAEALGFRSVIEKQIGGSPESIDLLLERGEQTIACEISVTTTIDHEVGNVIKCLKAGFSRVVVICLGEDRLRKIKAAVSGSLGSEAAARVEYHEPDRFIAYLKALPAPAPKDSETIRHGYKVKRTVPKLTLEEQRQKEEIAIRLLAEAMGRK